MPFNGFWAAVVLAQQLTLAPVTLAPESPALRADRFGARLHLLEETLRVPFGEDWGGEMRYFVRYDRLSVGVFGRAWSEEVCDRADCRGRALQAGADLKISVTPTLDVGLDMSAVRSGRQRAGSMIGSRLRLKF